MRGPLPFHPGWHRMPMPAGEITVRWSEDAWDALGPQQLPTPELLWTGAGPTETPLVIPASWRAIPRIAEKLDAGYALRRAAGLPTYEP